MASKTVALRSAVQAKLKTICDRVYYDHAEQNAEFPYLVFNVEEVQHDYGAISCDLEINAIDYGRDTSTCETLADNVQASLDKWRYLDDDIQFSAYCDRRNSVQEEDKKIIRRRMTFEVRMHERG